MWDLSSLAKEQTFSICKCFAFQRRSLTTGPPRKSLYLLFNTYYMIIILGTVHFPCRSRFSLGFKFLLTWDLLKNISYIVCWWWCSLVVVVCLRKYFILFLMCNFLVYRILSQLYFSQHLWCGAMFHVPNFICLPLFHMPNLLSSPFFVLLCLFFLLVTFLWLIVLIHELWCAFVELSYFLSSS